MTYTREQLEQMDTDELDRLAFGMADGDVVSVKPAAVRILYPGDLDNPQARFDQEGMAWARSVDLSEPVDLSVNDAGDLCLEDGHHRWFAAKKCSRSLRGTVTIKGKPIERLLLLQEAAPTATNRSRRPGKHSGR